jgi:hypothetical protein
MEDLVQYGKPKPGLHWVKNKLYYHEFQLCHWWFKSHLLKGKRIMVKLSFPTSAEFDQLTETKSVNNLKRILEKEANLFIAKVKEYERTSN